MIVDLMPCNARAAIMITRLSTIPAKSDAAAK